MHLEPVTVFAESSSVPDPRPAGRTAYITKNRKFVLEMVLECAKAGRVPSAIEILTWMDLEHPEEDGDYIDSSSDFKTFGIDDAFDIMEREICYLSTFGNLGHSGTTLLRQYTWDNILVPLGLWSTKAESCGSSAEKPWDLGRVIRWRRDVEDGYVEEVEEFEEKKEEVKEEEVEEVEEVSGGDDSDIEEIETWEDDEFEV